MVDAAASKAAVRKDVRVRVPPPVFKGSMEQVSSIGPY